MKNLCFEIKGNGNLCLATSYDGSGKCGRHNGLSQRTIKTIEEMKGAGYEPNGDKIMYKKKSIKRTLSRDSDGDTIMRKGSK